MTSEHDDVANEADATGAPEPEDEAPEAPRRRRRERRPEPPPAPVYTDEGILGTVPERVTLRDLERSRYGDSSPWLATAVLAFAAATALWLATFTAAQVTGAAVAIPTIERGVEAFTGLRELLVLHEQEIGVAAAAAPADDTPIPVPGFEVPGVALTSVEALTGTPESWHASLRRAAAESVHRNGIDALALTPEATHGGWFSTPGGARAVMHLLSDSNHGLAVLISWPLGLIALALGVLVVLSARSLGRIQALGVGLFLAAIPVAVLGLAGMGLVAFVGSDGSPLADTFAEMAGAVARAPLRNALTMLGAGLLVSLPALAARTVLDRMQPDPVVAEAE